MDRVTRHLLFCVVFFVFFEKEWEYVFLIIETQTTQRLKGFLFDRNIVRELIMSHSLACRDASCNLLLLLLFLLHVFFASNFTFKSSEWCSVGQCGVGRRSGRRRRYGGAVAQFTAVLFVWLCALIKTPFEKLLLSDLTTPSRGKKPDDNI